jgi:hypothetical protein
MKKTMLVKGAAVICLVSLMLMGFTASVSAQDPTTGRVESTVKVADEGSGNVRGEAFLIGAATIAPYLSASIAQLIHSTVGIVANLMPAETEKEPEVDKPAPQIAASLD